MGNRWQRSDAPRGNDYDARWAAMAAQGRSVHGEADLVDSLLRETGGSRVLDAGCGTGRVAIELARRGYAVMGVDADAAMLEVARQKQHQLVWVEADLTDLSTAVDAEFDLIVLAGNVMIFLEPGTEEKVLTELTGRMARGGLLVSGFQLRPDRLSLNGYDGLCASIGLELVSRWSTWTRELYSGGDYAVSTHRLPS